MTHLPFATVLLLAALTMPARADAQWGPMVPGYPTWRWGAPESDLRLDIEPRQASVYVDGYFSGIVDDFDGALQRLHLPPGEHDVVIYLEGYRSLHQRLYLEPNRTRRIAGILERLAPGAAPDPMPTPAEFPSTSPLLNPDDPTAGYSLPGPRTPRQPATPAIPPSPADPSRAPMPSPDERTGSPVASASATLSISVRPGGSVVVIDGERWQGPSDADERLIVQVSEGSHTVEISRDGYQPFASRVDARDGQTVPLTVVLRRD